MELIDARPLIADAGLGRYTTDPAAIIGVAIHHSVSGGQFFTAAILTQADEQNHLRMIDAYHVSQGWNAFGYHMAAFPSGRRYLCGTLNGARAHVASRNHELIGIVLIGDFTRAPPPLPQLAAAGACLLFALATYPGRPARGHGQWALPAYATSCPGATWPSWLSKVQSPQEDDVITEADFQRIAGIVRAELAATHPAIAGPPQPPPPRRTYTVAEGDNLWDIAARFYGDGTRWPEIAAASGLANPSLIHVGDVLTLP